MSVLTMPAEQYFAADGISKSALDWIADPKTPAHFHARFITCEIEEEETDAMRLGSITHRAILEPDTMAGAFHIKPIGMKFTTTEGKAWRDSHKDLPTITHDEHNAMHQMRAAVWKNPMAKRLLTGAQTEQCLFANDSDGTLRKARLDAVPRGGNALADLKTIGSADSGSLEYAINDYRYHVQAAYYLDLAKLCGMEFENFVFIFVEKEAPWLVTVRPIDAESLEIGRRIYKRDLALYRHCVAENHWPGYGSDGEEIGLPARVRKQFEAVI